MPTVVLASDHAGYELKNLVRDHLEETGVPYVDLGVNSGESVDYPVYAEKACREVVAGRADLALLFCGTGVGISMAANKIHGIRACCCSDVFSAEFSRRHNNANALCLGGRVVGAGLAEKLVDTFLSAAYEGERHQRRVDLIAQLES